MNRKINLALNVLLVVVVCLTLFAGCTTEKVDPWEIEESLDLVGKLVKAMHGWIGSYGWTVVVFTVFLKILMLPLDIWQRYSTRKMAVKMQIMQPYVAEIDKRYGANSQKGAEEKQKLFKKHGYSMTSSCLPMIITMVVFFIMFGGLRSYSTYNSVHTFNELTQTYYQTYASEIVNTTIDTDAEQKAYDVFVENYKALGGTLTTDGKYDLSKFDKNEYNRVAKSLVAVTAKVEELKKSTVAEDNQLATDIQSLLDEHKTTVKENVKTRYSEVEEGWLWIQNIAQPDTWESIMPKYNSGTNSFTTLVNMENYGSSDKGETLYNTIREAVLETGRHEGGKWNGYMILPILSIALSFLSMFISQAMEKKNRKGQVQAQDQQQQATNKTMMIMMPLMMAYFGFIYTGAFAIYMVVNYLISIISTVALRVPVEKMVERNIAKTSGDSGKASYMR